MDVPDGMMAKINDLERKVDRTRSLDSGPSGGEVLSEFLTLPHLRGFWTLGNISESFYIDMSGQGRHFAAAGPPFPGQTFRDNGIHFITLNGTSSYLTRSDEAGLDIVGSITFGGMFRFDRTASSQGLFGKYNSTGSQRSYLLAEESGSLRLYISPNGSSITTVTSSLSYTSIGGAGSWAFIVGRYVPSTEMAIFVNGVKTVLTSGVPSSIFNSTAQLQAGAYGSGLALFQGGMSCLFLCATSVSDTFLDRLWRKIRLFFSL